MRFPILLLALLPLGACATPNRPAPSVERFAVTATALPLDPAAARRDGVGALRWLGTLHLRAAPGARLGGLSALRWDRGRLLAASDEGNLFVLVPQERGGRLVGISAARRRRFAGADGRPLPDDKSRADIESLEVLPDPSCRGDCAAALVSLESDSSIWRYRLEGGLPVGSGQPVPGGEAWRAAQSHTNGGIEAQAAGGRVRLMLSEEMREPDGSASALLIADGVEQRLGVPLEGAFAPTDLVLLDPARPRFLLLQRDYRPGIGTWARLSRFDLVRGEDSRWRAGPVDTLATFGPPLTTDNMEGLALRQESGRTFLYMVSDDNFSDKQRTLLMKWEVVG